MTVAMTLFDSLFAALASIEATVTHTNPSAKWKETQSSASQHYHVQGSKLLKYIAQQCLTMGKRGVKQSHGGRIDEHLGGPCRASAQSGGFHTAEPLCALIAPSALVPPVAAGAPANSFVR